MHSPPPPERIPWQEQARTASTEAQYEVVARRISHQAARQLGLLVASPLEVVEYAVSKRDSWRLSTWRANRAALIHYFHSVGAIEAAEQLAQTRYDLSSKQQKEARSALPLRTGAQRVKSLPDKSRDAVVQYLQANGSETACLTLDWLEFGWMFGLRPHEWQGAEIVKSDGSDGTKRGATILRVRNAKNTNQRAHGEFRSLTLSHLSPHDRARLAVFLDAHHSANAAGDWGKLYARVRQLLLRANNAQGLKRKVALYSSRHQFSADAKKAGLAKAEVAALMGHASDETATEHYGRAVSGRSGFALEANPEEVKRVRLKSTEFTKRAPDTVSPPSPASLPTPRPAPSS